MTLLTATPRPRGGALTAYCPTLTIGSFRNLSDTWRSVCSNIYYAALSANVSVFFITRKSSYCFQRVLAIAILSVRPYVCPSVRLSVTRVDQAKTVQARITKFLPSAARKTLVSGTVKLFHKLEGGHPNEGAKWEGVGKICDFWPLTRCISVTVQDKA